jgi:hypothetical protein
MAEKGRSLRRHHGMGAAVPGQRSHERYLVVRRRELDLHTDQYSEQGVSPRVFVVRPQKSNSAWSVGSRPEVDLVRELKSGGV